MNFQILLLFSGRKSEVELLRSMSNYDGLKIKFFDTDINKLQKNDSTVDEIEYFHRRIEIGDFIDSNGRDCYLCGPEGFMSQVEKYLVQSGAKSISKESFF